MTVKLITKELNQRTRPSVAVSKDLKLSEHMRQVNSIADGKGGTYPVWEFVGTTDFGTEWNNRQQYEIDAGRDEEPLLYESLYETSVNPNFEKNVTINMLGPGGVFFSAVTEGGEIKFAEIGASQKSIEIVDYAVGLQYSEQLVRYNMMWDVGIFERQAGIAHNALLNHIHLYPFISASYAAANQTAASAIGTTLAEKTLRTLEDAITSAKTDTTNPRRGQYDLLVSASNAFTVERALRGADVIGVDMQSSARSMIRNVIVYDGWSGTMNNLTVSYPGVTANKAYLIDVQPTNKMKYARSLVKFLLDRAEGNPDISRLLAAQIRLWSALGVYCSPLAISEEITLPTS